MTSLVDIANTALLEAGNTVLITSFSDGTPASIAASQLTQQKIQMMMRAAPWDSLRAQAPLTLYKAAIVNGAVSANPPPQPWGYEYLWPADCLRLRFIQPTLNTAPAGTPLTTAPNVSYSWLGVPTSAPFVVSTDFDATGNPIKTILTNVSASQAIYTRDLSNFPDLWDQLFRSAATAMLAAYFCNALTRNKTQMEVQIGIAKGALDQARAMNASESISNQDHTPDWMAIRQASAVPWAWNQTGPVGVSGGWDLCQMPNGQFY